MSHAPEQLPYRLQFLSSMLWTRRLKQLNSFWDLSMLVSPRGGASTIEVCQIPTHPPASPAVPPAAISLGPEQVTDQVRAEKRTEVQGRKKGEKCACAESVPMAPPQKKRKTIPPELEEWQKTASARLLELGVLAFQVRTYFRTHDQFNYPLFPCLIIFQQL